VIRSEEYGCGDMRQFATNGGGLRQTRQFATNHDVLRQLSRPSPTQNGQQRRGKEHKRLFSGVVVFLIQAPHLQWFTVLCKLPPRFSICLAPERALTDEEKNHTNARNAAQ